MKTYGVLVVLAVAVLPGEAWWFSSDSRVEPHDEINDECLQYAAWGRCEFYECLERRFPCGHQGYAVHLGLHFCRRIYDMLDEFTADGYWWMNRTSVCLTNTLLPVYQSYSTRCGDIKDDGAEGIITCNNRVDPDGQDFCSFVHDNKGPYQDIFGMEELRRMVRLGKPGVLARLFVDGASCGADMLEDRLHAFTGSVNDMIGSLMEQVTGLRDRWNSFWN